MPTRTRNELTAGIFVVATLALLLGIVLWLGASNLFVRVHQEVAFYVNETDPNPGLKVGNGVWLPGLKIGQIVQVRFMPDEGRTIFIAQIDHPEVTIHADSKTYVATGLVGDSALVITRGTKDAPLANTDHPVQIGGGLDQAVQDIAASARQLRETIEADFDRDKADSLARKIHNIADSLAAASADIATITGNVTPQSDVDNEGSVMANVHASSAKLEALVVKLHEGADNFSKLLVQANKVMVKVNEGEGTIGKLVVDDRLHRELLDTAHQLTLMLKEAQSLLKDWQNRGVQLKLK
ncbi:MAG: MlaD family protein [Planctomycetota bacterium]|jgi:phospholipid/cholesterol/gamma-HCH transport system substrate-binding protein